jgi:hypothetical protein
MCLSTSDLITIFVFWLGIVPLGIILTIYFLIYQLAKFLDKLDLQKQKTTEQ